MHIFVFLLVLLSLVSNVSLQNNFLIFFFKVYSSIAIKSFSEFDHLKSKRSIDTNVSNEWDTTIDYYIKYHPWTDVIERSLKDISDNSCFKFNKKTNPLTNTYGIIFDDGYDCKYDYNHRNPNPNKPNVIYVGNCYEPYGAIRKLILNVLGLRGEHKRYDRDQYINTYNYERMSEQGRVEFQYDDNKTTETYGFGYDFSSITHAGVNDYKKGSALSFDAQKYSEYYRDTMGQRLRPSFSDYKTINKRYCESACPEKIGCQFNGYQNPKKCDECKCPSGFEGKDCGLLARSSHDCGNVRFTATPTEQTLEARGSKSCWYKIVASQGKRVMIKLGVIIITEQKSPCLEEHEGVQIKYRTDRGPAGLCICKSNGVALTTNYNDYTIQSEDNTVFIHFKGILQDSRAVLYYREI
uniref:Metalloendopeptidase n=1 Tax=Parastrongyloides trichosuri TaxID=131310 RepID=A0A0N4Z1F0_PARTI